MAKEIVEKSGCSYGSRRLQKALNAAGFVIGRYKTRAVIKEAEIKVRYRKKYKVTTQSDHKKPVFENVLNRSFSPDAPDRAYVLE